MHFYNFFKRIFDLLISILIVVLLLPGFLLIALLIVINSKGTIFFVQDRVGRNGKNFKILKFRTMIQEAALNGPGLTQKNDPRITRIGRFLRRYKIDEWPQFFNVIRGQMSLVGPRPEIPSIVGKYTNYQKRVLDVKPGIFGPSQIIGRFEEEAYPDNIDVEKFYLYNVLSPKLDRDLAYLQERSFIKDFCYFISGITTTLKVFIPYGKKAPF